MNWGAPAYAWLALLAVPAVILAVPAWRRRRHALRRLTGDSGIASAMTHSGRGAVFAGWALPAAACLLVIIALCRPQWGMVAEERRTEGLDIIVAMDTSRSMLADDLRPNRLAAAREAIAVLAGKLRGDRIGLIAFAGSAFPVCPLTTDYGLFNQALSEVGADTIPLGGTSLAALLSETGRAFAGNEGSGKVLILVSDGEDHGDSRAAAVRALRESGVTVHTVAAGTSGGGLIPLPDGEYLKDRAGCVVKSRMQPAVLREIADAGGGRQLDLAAGPAVLADLYGNELAALERKDILSIRKRLRERFQVPLVLALALLVIEPFLFNFAIKMTSKRRVR